MTCFKGPGDMLAFTMDQVASRELEHFPFIHNSSRETVGHITVVEIVVRC